MAMNTPGVRRRSTGPLINPQDRLSIFLETARVQAKLGHLPEASKVILWVNQTDDMASNPYGCTISWNWGCCILEPCRLCKMRTMSLKNPLSLGGWSHTCEWSSNQANQMIFANGLNRIQMAEADISLRQRDVNAALRLLQAIPSSSPIFPKAKIKV